MNKLKFAAILSALCKSFGGRGGSEDNLQGSPGNGLFYCFVNS